MSDDIAQDFADTFRGAVNPQEETATASQDPVEDWSDATTEFGVLVTTTRLPV